MQSEQASKQIEQANTENKYVYSSSGAGSLLSSILGELQNFTVALNIERRRQTNRTTPGTRKAESLNCCFLFDFIAF